MGQGALDVVEATGGSFAVLEESSSQVEAGPGQVLRAGYNVCCPEILGEMVGFKNTNYGFYSTVLRTWCMCAGHIFLSLLESC